MKPHHHHLAAALILAAGLNPALMPQAAAATMSLPAPVTNIQAGSPQHIVHTLSAPFDGGMAELPTPVKYGLLLIGLSLIDKLARTRSHS